MTASAPSPASVPVVGIGASAGGLAALKELFAQVPADSGLAWVVVFHQHRGHTSMLPDLLGRQTPLPVAEVADGDEVEADHVYVAPPGLRLALVDGTLRVTEPPPGRKIPLPIDHFFRSLAEARQSSALCVVLSGTGSDGTLGAKVIRGAGGLVAAQDPSTAAYDGMPRSAIEADVVDHVAVPGSIAGWLVDRRGTNPPRPATAQDAPPQDLDTVLEAIHRLVLDHTGTDFSHYKHGTIGRRIRRRMDLHGLDTAEDYLRYLRREPTEIDKLFQELLIGVTSFFRDADAFAALEAALRRYLRDKPDRAAFRAWIAGCSTGEEAYSIALLVEEIMRDLDKRFEVQIFATDLDERAIDIARKGRFPAGIAADVPEDYLARHFVHDGEGFRIREEIREMLVFAPHNVIADPPFTRLDLLSCRNLLIYLQASLQQRLLPVLHYALRVDGLLFLGSSESISEYSDLFEPIDARARVFRKRESDAQRPIDLPLVVGQRRFASVPASPPDRALTETATPLSSRIERALLDQFVPPAVVVNERREAVHFVGRTGRFLEPAEGTPSHEVLQMARPGLRAALAAALHHVIQERTPIRYEGVEVRSDPEGGSVAVAATPLDDTETLSGLFLVTFEDLPAPDDQVATGPPVDSDRTGALEEELRRTKETLQRTVEQYETTNEELKSTNEELQSTNEELQSANEELETGKEEMQSLNEELQTVNAELQDKLDDLSQANDDMRNLLDSTDVATLFLDDQLRIQRFTDPARGVMNLIDSDVGRPVTDLTSRLDYDGLAADAREVLHKLVPRQQEVQADDDAWYQVRILPYRTVDNVIEGVVVTFVDITATKRAEARLAAVVETVHEPVIVLDAGLKVMMANPAIQQWLQVEGDATGRHFLDLTPPGWDTSSLLGTVRGLLEGDRAETLVDVDLPASPGGATCATVRMLANPGLEHPQVLLAFRGVTLDT